MTAIKPFLTPPMMMNFRRLTMRRHVQQALTVVGFALLSVAIGCAHQPAGGPAKTSLQDSDWFMAESQRVMGFIEYSLADGSEKNAALAVVRNPGGFGVVHLRRSDSKEED